LPAASVESLFADDRQFDVRDLANDLADRLAGDESDELEIEIA
jgi:hypothetical protein